MTLLDRWNSFVAFLKQRSRREWVLTSVAALLIIPVLMAAFAPLLAPIPTQAAGWSAPPLPERDEPLPDVQHLLEPLPLVVRDLPDAASREMVAIYDATSFNDGESVSRMLKQAEAAIQLPANLDTVWRSWLHNWQGDSIPDSVMTYLQKDPLNADRLSNLATAMYLDWIAMNSTDSSEAYFGRVSQGLHLLDSSVEYFPESRAPILNYMFILSAGWPGGPDGNRGDDFDAWLISHADDVSALQLAVRLYVTGSIWGYDQDTDTLITLASRMSESDDPARAALGHAFLGDILLGNLQMGTNTHLTRMEEAPFSLMHLARLALEHYDKALLFSDDPSIYTARAQAVSLLGDIPSAIASQQRAIDFNPESIPLRLLLADLFLQTRGSIEQRRESIEVARVIEREAISIAMTQPMPSLSDIRVMVHDGELVGFAAIRPERFYLLITGPFAGGGYTVDFNKIPLFDRSPMGFGWNPAVRAITGVVSKSEALGDTEGLAQDLAMSQAIHEETGWWTNSSTAVAQSSAVIARLVATPSDRSVVVQYPFEVSIAASWLRFVGANQDAVSLCQAALDFGFDTDSLDTLWRCVAENAYLAGDYKLAQDAFESVNDEFMTGYVAERRGDIDEAIRRYLIVVESNSDHGYIAMLRLADALLDSGDPSRAIAYYDQLIEWMIGDPFGVVDMASLPVEAMLPLAQSNRGIAWLQVQADRNGRIDCEGEAWEACTAALMDFDAALASDPYNPVFLMNKAWAARLLGDQDLSTDLMTQARESDPTLYPVLNDLGVFAADSGETDAARQYFRDAIAANPRYDLALWNLGVLEMREGIGGIFRGQAYLARAIVQNPSLVTKSMEFLTDERVYRVEIDEQLRPGAGWSFGAASSIAASAFGFVTVALVLFHATYLVVRDTLVERLHGRVESQAAWIRTLAAGKLPFTVDARWERWLVLAIPLAVLVFTTTWIARHGEPHAAAASAVLALFAVLLAVVVHEVGHALVAWRMQATFEPAQWAPGSVLALVLLPLSVSSGPFPGQKVVAGDQATAKWIYVAGPLANLAVAVLAYLLFMMQPLPGLRMISQVQLAAMGYALLPFVPLDGAEIARSYPRLLGLLGGTAMLLGVLFTVGIL